MDLIPGINATADALNAEKIRMDVIATNIANANTTRDVNGEVYKRKQVVFEAYLDKTASGSQPAATGVRVAEITEDTTPGPKIYNPDHPHADSEGMVEMPNVKMSWEMVDLIFASRAYEANLSVVRTARQMAQKALAIGR